MPKKLVKFSREMDLSLIEMVKNNPALYDSTSPDYKNTSVKENIWINIAEKLGRKVEESKIRWKSMRDVYLRKKRMASIVTPSPRKRYSPWEYMENMNFIDSILTRGAGANESMQFDDIDIDSPPTPENISFKQDPDEEVSRELLSEDFASDDNESDGSENETLCEDITQQAEGSRQAYGDHTHLKNDESNTKLRKRRNDNKNLTLFIQSDQTNAAIIGIREKSIRAFFACIADTVISFAPDLAAIAKLEVCKLVTDMELQHLGQKSTWQKSNCEL